MSKHVYAEGEYLLRLHVERLPEGKYLATSADLPDLLAQADTLNETIECARDVAKQLLESYREHGEPLPPFLRAASAHVEVDTAIALQMGRLSGFGYNDVIVRLRNAGFLLDRQARGSHEIWYNPATRRRTILPHHSGDIPEGTLRAILKRADITVESFLEK